MRLRRAAFFDVDETLLAVPSLWRFLRHHLEQRHRDRTVAAAEFGRITGGLGARAASGVPREELCREYFRLFTGQDAARLAEQGEAWFAAEQAEGRVFNQPVLRALSHHAASGDLTVLVSGSFPACLDPVARAVGADGLLCSRPEVRAGRYTGELPLPMVGEAKAQAVRAFATRVGVDLGVSTAYGDHLSDLPLLRLVGHPVGVGNDPALAAVADALGWTRITDVPAAAGATGSDLRQPV
jgi:HAD superfamily hydrolase (TIGR01490 family)